VYDVAIAVVIRLTGFGRSFANPLNDNHVSLGDQIEQGRGWRTGKLVTLWYERILD
jgi:hypothetical protein